VTQSAGHTGVAWDVGCGGGFWVDGGNRLVDSKGARDKKRRLDRLRQGKKNASNHRGSRRGYPGTQLEEVEENQNSTRRGGDP